MPELPPVVVSSPRPTLVAFTPKPVAVEEPDLTPLETVEEWLLAVRTGKIPAPTAVLIFAMEPQPDGGEIPTYWYKNTKAERLIAFGALIQEWGIRRWRGEDCGETIRP